MIRFRCYALALLAMLVLPLPAYASAVDELVAMGMRHEQAGDFDLAVRRYTEALSLSPRVLRAYLLLGRLRLRMGDTREAERVFDVALAHVPGAREALLGRADARWASGRVSLAVLDLTNYALAERRVAPFERLADWYGTLGQRPAQLAAYRRAQTFAATVEERARVSRFVHALCILVDTADPVTNPAHADPVRRGLAAFARRSVGEKPTR